MWWPRLQDTLTKIIETETSNQDQVPLRKDREILEEILELSRLNSKRIAPRAVFPTRLIHDLVVSLKEAVAAIQEETDPQAALRALSGMADPLRFLIHRSRIDELNSDLVKEFESLDFVYQGLEEDDDEIPF